MVIFYMRVGSLIAFLSIPVCSSILELVAGGAQIFGVSIPVFVRTQVVVGVSAVALVTDLTHPFCVMRSRFVNARHLLQYRLVATDFYAFWLILASQFLSYLLNYFCFLAHSFKTFLGLQIHLKLKGQLWPIFHFFLFHFINYKNKY